MFVVFNPPKLSECEIILTNFPFNEEVVSFQPYLSG